VDFDFTSSTLKKLATEEQIAKYRQLASQMERVGEHAIANLWRRLVAELLKLKG
jgi:hypothetical protein